MANTKYKPEWSKYEEEMHSDNPEVSRIGTEKFTQAREEELRKSSEARKWESSRKAEWAKLKPEWTKARQKQQQNPIEKFKKDIKSAGTFDTGMKPTPGYLIVDLGEKEVEKTTESGLILPSSASDDALQNTGKVLDVGDEVVIESPYKVPQPCKPGEKILFKKGAGIDMEISGHMCRFMGFSDVLAVFYE